MIEEIPGRPEGTLEFKLTGKVTGRDYDHILTPAIDKALQDHERIRILVQIGPGFEGYALDAAWDDTRLGLRHWSGFDRIAIVSDVDWVKTTFKAFGFALPCPVRTFDLAEHDDARRWLSESLGSIHVAKRDGDQVEVRLQGKLETSAYENIGGDLDAIIADVGRIKLLLDLRDFDGWQGLGALGTHLSLVREHRRAPKKVAVVGDAFFLPLARRVFSVFSDAEVKYFEGKDFAEAEKWIAAQA